MNDAETDGLEECREAFRLFDKNDDGYISTKELLTVLRSIGQEPSEKTLAEIVHLHDNDGDGRIGFDEFLVIVERLRENTETEEELGEIFNVIDVDGDGEICKSDLRHIAHRITYTMTSYPISPRVVMATTYRLRSTLLTQQLDEMIDEFDKDGDGSIDFEEFKKILVS